MQQTVFAYPYVICMMPVEPMMGMSSSGGAFMQAQPGFDFPHHSWSAVQHIPSQALGHQFQTPHACSALSICHAVPQINTPTLPGNSASNQAQIAQLSSKKRINKLVNKTIAPSPIMRATAMAKVSGEKLCRVILGGWRYKTACRIAAKKFNTVQRARMRKALETWRCFHSDVEPDEDSDENTLSQTFATTFQERLLRLALLGWHNADTELAVNKATLQRTSSLIASFMSDISTTLSDRTRSVESEITSYVDSVSLIERTQSVQSEIVSNIDSTSSDENVSITSKLVDDELSPLEGFGFLGDQPTWELPRVIRGFGQQRRIGVDLGGVIFVARAKRLILKALEGVRGLVEMFGPENVFIVSRVTLNGSVHEACRTALTKPGGFLEKTGIPLENVVFVSDVDGPKGKGVVSARLGLTHFIDDRQDVLHSVYADEAGNSRDLIGQFNGTLFHFKPSGSGTLKQAKLARMPAGLENSYHAVSGWSELLEWFGKDIDDDQAQPHSSVFTKSMVEVHRIPVGTSEEIGLRIGSRLMGGFKEIEDSAGVNIFLRGRGSPQAQPKSEEQNPLSVVVRTKANGKGSLDIAVSQVERLLHSVISSVV